VILDHHPSEDWDDRSVELFPVRKLRAPADPTRPYWWTGTIKLNQGDTGHCGGFGLANEAGSSPFRVPVSDAYAHGAYYEIKDRRLDPFGREDGTSSLAVAKLGVLRNLWDSYWWVQSADDIVTGLSLGPVCFGLSWMTGMFYPDRYGFIHPTGRDEGGHFVCANGYSPNYRRRGPTVRIAQSWGAEHGMNGNVYIPLDELGDLTLGRVSRYRGEGFVPVGRDYPVR
jgi:hypothetical protein